jgi:hypothetical protein
MKHTLTGRRTAEVVMTAQTPNAESQHSTTFRTIVAGGARMSVCLHTPFYSKEIRHGPSESSRPFVSDFFPALPSLSDVAMAVRDLSVVGEKK